MGVAKELRDRARPIWDKIIVHPFVVEVYRGVLPVEKFKYYLLQDYYYLIHFTKALALAAAKAPDVSSMKLALSLAYGTVTGEMANYEALLREVGLSIEAAAAAEPNDVNKAYMDFLAATCALEGFYQCMAAVLPCFWTYAEIAEKHKEALKDNKIDVYVKWASTYLSKEYRELVESLRALLNSSGASAEELWPYFKRASEYELKFWQAAYESH
ncbi:MAG: thiaminase II [Pyrobaculum sp.]